MSGTPLTDAINALTTYSNTVTGASDTTLSEAVATLASGYGGGSYVTPLYPFTFPLVVNNTEIGTATSYRKSDCLHCKLSFTANGSAAIFINFGKQVSSHATNNIINGMPLWFVIPAGKQTVFQFKNVNNPDGIQFRGNFRKAGASENVSGYTMNDGTYTNGYTMTVTQTTEQNVGCFWLSVPSASITSVANKTLEFDVSFTVDGDLYF